jgi:hypothetical protein
MCMVSAVGDNWKDTYPNRYPTFYPPVTFPPLQTGPTLAEFEALKKEVQELKIMLEAAKKFDEATGQKDCEMDEKVDLIKKVAEMVGVDLGEVFGK